MLLLLLLQLYVEQGIGCQLDVYVEQGVGCQQDAQLVVYLLLLCRAHPVGLQSIGMDIARIVIPLLLKPDQANIRQALCECLATPSVVVAR